MLNSIKKLNLILTIIFLLSLINYNLVTSFGRSFGEISFKLNENTKLVSYNITNRSYRTTLLKRSKPAPFRLAILSLLVSDFVTDNYQKLNNRLFEFDVIRFYEKILRKGGTRGIGNYKNCCIDSCLSGLNNQGLNDTTILDNLFEDADSNSICEGLCDHTLQYLKSMDYFFTPSSELFELNISRKEGDNLNIDQKNSINYSDIHFQGSTEEQDDIAKLQNFFLDNIQDYGNKTDSNNLIYVDEINDYSSSKDMSVMNFMDDGDFESEENSNVSSRLLLLWDVDKTLRDVYRIMDRLSTFNGVGKYNPYSMSLLFLLKERQQYDPRILDQYIVTYGMATIKKLQSLFLKRLCYSCWDIMRIYDRYFAEENDSQIKQDYKRILEAKEQSTLIFPGEEYKFRNCPGSLKNILFWRGKDIELIRNHIVSTDENLRNEFMDFNDTLSKLEIDNNFRIPFKVRGRRKIDDIVTILVDDTISHVRLACVEEYHEFNIIVIPLVPFIGLNIEERIKLEMRDDHPNQLTQDVFESGILEIKGVDSKHLPGIINSVLNQVPLNSSSDELSKAIRTKLSALVPGIFPESQCNYDITKPKPLYFIFLSSCKLFNDIINLLSNLPESHPSFKDIEYLLSTVDTWGFDENKKSRACSILNDRITEFTKICLRTKNNKLRDSNKSDSKDKAFKKRICSLNWRNKFFFGFGLRGLFGPIPLNALVASLLPRKKTIILNIEADHLFNNIPLNFYKNKFFYCTIKTNLFLSISETIRKIPIAMKTALEFAANANVNSPKKDKLKDSLAIVTNSTKVFQNQLINLFERSDSSTLDNRGHYKIYEQYTNCTFVE